MGPFVHSPRRGAKWPTGCAIAVLCLVNQSMAAPLPMAPVYADYNSELREVIARGDGIQHVDTPKLIQKLLAAKIRTYAYLVWHRTTDWDDFRLEFLPAAQAAGLEVWLYLTPPTENHPPEAYVPFGTNYIQWAAEAGKLARQYPTLKALAIDDFNSNQGFFTPEYVGSMLAAAREHSTNFMFFPVVYDVSHAPGAPTRNISPAFIHAYGASCSGVIFPYLNWTNKDDISDEAAQIKANSEILNGKYAQFLVQYPSYTVSQIGDYSAVRAVLTSSNDFPDRPYPFCFRVSDSYTGATAGYHKLQLLVDSAIVWEGDAAGATGIQDITLNLQSNLVGKTSATVVARLYDAKSVTNYRVTASWNLPAATWAIEERGSFQGTGTLDPAHPEFKVPLIVMIYDGGYGSGTNRWTPSLDYVRRANETALESVRTRVAAGIIQYCLDKSDGSQQYPIIQSLYTAWVFRPWFDPITLLADGTTVIEGGNGEPGRAFTLRGSSILQISPALWRTVGSGTFDAAGDFRITDTVLRNNSPRFYTITQ